MNPGKPNHQIDYLELSASHLGITKDFYTSVFGWKFEDYGPDYTSFFDGRLGGGFVRRKPPAAAGILVVIYAADLALTHEKIKAAGGVIVKDIFPFPGGRRFHFADPSGNELAVWSE